MDETDETDETAIPRMKRTSTPGSWGMGSSVPSGSLRRIVKRAAHLPGGMSGGCRGLQSGAATRPSTWGDGTHGYMRLRRRHEAI